MAGLWSAVRPFLKAVRYAPDRLLHPFRRRRALIASRRAEPLRRILVLCHGNICRSPYAAAVLRRELMARWPGETRNRVPSVRSAGFILPGRPSPPTARSVAARGGVELSEHRSRTFDSEELSRTELVLVMDTRQRADVRRLGARANCPVILLGDLDPGPVRRRPILDPLDRPEEVFEEVYRRIDRCVRALAETVVAGPAARG